MVHFSIVCDAGCYGYMRFVIKLNVKIDCFRFPNIMIVTPNYIIIISHMQILSMATPKS